MITFLPYANFAQTARCLDWQRLGKQRVEARQVLFAITQPDDRLRKAGFSKRGKPLISYNDDTAKPEWRRHPAALMWRGYASALAQYGDFIIMEWVYRGYNNNMSLSGFLDVESIDYPPWLGDEKLHNSHKAALLFKNPEFYQRFGWDVQPAQGYYWPTRGL
jgi:hypothetical protein